MYVCVHMRIDELQQRVSKKEDSVRVINSGEIAPKSDVSMNESQQVPTYRTYIYNLALRVKVLEAKRREI